MIDWQLYPDLARLVRSSLAQSMRSMRRPGRDARLTGGMRQAIMRRWRAGERADQLARDYGVSIATVYRALHQEAKLRDHAASGRLTARNHSGANRQRLRQSMESGRK